MSCFVRRRASAASSFSASSTASRTNCLMIVSPHGPERALAEAAAEPLDAGDADAVHLARVAVEHHDAGVGENLADLVGFARLDVVVAEDRHRRYGDASEFACEHPRFLRQAVVGEIAGNQQHVRRLGCLANSG